MRTVLSWPERRAPGKSADRRHFMNRISQPLPAGDAGGEPLVSFAEFRRQAQRRRAQHISALLGRHFGNLWVETGQPQRTAERTSDRLADLPGIDRLVTANTSS